LNVSAGQGDSQIDIYKGQLEGPVGALNNSEVFAQFFNEFTSLVYMLIFNYGFVRAVEVGFKEALSRNPPCKTISQSSFTGNDNIKKSVFCKYSFDFSQS